MSWLAKILPPKIRPDASKGKSSMPEGLWIKCPKCAAIMHKSELANNMNVCPHCSHHMRIGGRARLEHFLDADGREEIGQEVLPQDPLKFKDTKKYTDRLKVAKAETGEDDSLIVMRGTVKSLPVVAASFDFGFMGGSMASVTGERFVRGVHVALENRIPFICFTATGGARMQEGLLSLMQMAKTNAAVAKLGQAKIPFIDVLTDPTMGGVSASFAFLGDVVIAEPNALIGFAGPRVIENTVRETLPEGFQRAEFMLEKGALDMICDRRNLRDSVSELLRKLQNISAQLPEPSAMGSTEEKA
ncbi:MAG: acetyl-CoA carboxylase, carboxyltransferase subunit beta [Saezia sp.]